jgi:hypothetical protein
MAIQEPEGWRELWERAQAERDTKKLLDLIDEMNRLLAGWEKKNRAETIPPASDSKGASPKS